MQSVLVSKASDSSESDSSEEVVWRRAEGWQDKVPQSVWDALPDPEESLPAIFARRYEEDPTAVALHVVSLAGAELDAAPITFEQLWERVHRAAALLDARGVEAGDRVVLSLDGIADFVAFFLASMGLQAIPVPLPPVTELRMPQAFIERIESVCQDCRPRVLVGDLPERWADLELDGGIVEIFVDANNLADADAAEITLDFDCELSQPAYLQYTSGSTGHPKGVVVTHGNAVANLRASTLGGHFSPADRSFSWLPLFHDMGLIGGPLLGLFVGFAPYLMRPSDFVTRPDSWLRGVEQFGATFIVAPNFAYAVAARKLPDRLVEGLDLSSVRLAFNGAEPIDHRTVKAFLERFAPCGFDPQAFFPVYGLAEATLSVAFPSPGETVRYDSVSRTGLAAEQLAEPADAEAASTATFVGVGRIVPEHDLIIRDLDTDRALDARQVGEICVRGPSVSPRYYEVDAEDDTAREELRTGDMGYVADGQLYVVDRIKDLIIVAGQNYAPSDIERHIGRLGGARKGRVVALTRTDETLGTEQLVVVCEVSPGHLRPLDELSDTIKRVVKRHFGLSVAELALVPPGSIPKTSSGKIKRRTTQQLLDAGRLDSMREPRVRVRETLRHLKKTGTRVALHWIQQLRAKSPIH
ncbi:fatty acyl-AMP ligase [Persicimonas caeni]|uniref:Fatty acyl-AMP ligase n=1 Tax=Persicimonas caeni TaxID=2292766 RepID=A0A4Y6PRI9_PERCE|nr:AMP-binding protein [Persicimonas caeni]QDG50729.1 fatty acyl-AMP ligase [Persicimonas caeni]QED31950.1 fatty acyl-AMP ligase [Persicimonas caeni]